MKWKIPSEIFRPLCPVTLSSVLQFSTWGSLNTAKKLWGFHEKEGQDGLPAVSSITNSYLVNPRVFIQYSFCAVYCSLRRNWECLPGVIPGEKRGEVPSPGLCLLLLLLLHRAAPAGSEAGTGLWLPRVAGEGTLGWNGTKQQLPEVSGGAGPAPCGSNLQQAAPKTCRVCPGHSERIAFTSKFLISVKKCVPIIATCFLNDLFWTILLYSVWFSSFVFILKMKKIHFRKLFFHRRLSIPPSAGTNPLVRLCRAAQHGISPTVPDAPQAKPGQGGCGRNSWPTTGRSAAPCPPVSRSSQLTAESLSAFRLELLIWFHFARCLSVCLLPCQEDRAMAFFSVRSRLPLQTYRHEGKP